MPHLGSYLLWRVFVEDLLLQLTHVSRENIESRTESAHNLFVTETRRLSPTDATSTNRRLLIGGDTISFSQREKADITTKAIISNKS